MFVIVTIASSWVRTSFGQRGVLSLAAVAGAADVDPFVLGLAQARVTELSPGTLAAAIRLPAASNNALKASYAVLFGGLTGRCRSAAILLCLALLGLVVAAIYLRIFSAAKSPHGDPHARDSPLTPQSQISRGAPAAEHAHERS
jgi:uncharacterized membrane protein (DUF4010 family)